HIIQARVIELLDHRLNSALDVGEVHHPTLRQLRVTLHMDTHPIRVPVQTPAGVPFRHMWQPVCGLEAELLEDLKHGWMLPYAAEADATSMPCVSAAAAVLRTPQWHRNAWARSPTREGSSVQE